MEQYLRLLIVEDVPDDAELMVMHLEEEGFDVKWQRVQTEKDFLKALEEEPDFILADWSLPSFSGLRALTLLKEKHLDIPFILISGSIGEEAAIDALHQGASDYILKDRSKRLGQAVRRTLDSRRYRKEKERAETDLKRRLAELEVLYTMSTSLRYLESLDEILTAMLDQILAAIDTDAGAIWLKKYDQDKLYLASSQGWYTGLNNFTIKSDESIVGYTYNKDQPYSCAEYVKDNKLSARALKVTPPGWGGALIPIYSHKEKIGVLDIAVPLPRIITDEEIKLLVSIAEMAGIAIHRTNIFEELQAAGTALASAYDETIKGWATALELRDKETEGHSERVTAFTVKMAKEMGISEEKLIHIYRGAILHDIGKMGVPDTILLKPGPLDDREWEIMRKHPQYAHEMLEPIDYLKPALNIPYCHHEKFDGTGYPRGLKGEEIPLEARIFAIIDVFDALTSDRPYRLAWSRKDALEHIKKESGRHFDPQVVTLFLELIDEFDPQET